MVDIDVKKEFEEIADLYNNLSDKIEEKYNDYKDIVGDYNLQECDILHYIELEKIDAVKGAKVLKLLRNVLAKRREAKNKLHYYQSFRARMKDGSIDVKQLLKDYNEPDNYTYKTNVLYEFNKFAHISYYSRPKEENEIPNQYLTIKEAGEKIRSKYKLKIHLIDANIRSLIKNNELIFRFINNTYYVNFDSLTKYLKKQNYIIGEK